MAKADATAARAFTCSAITLAKLFQVSRGVIHEWARNGMPQAAPGKFNLSDCVMWRRARDQAVAAASSGPLADERRRLLAAQRRGYEISNARAAAALLPAEDVVADIDAYSRLLDAELDRLAETAAVAVLEAAGDPPEVQRRLKAACRQTRIDLAAAFQRHGDGLDDDGDGAGHGG